MLSNRNFLVLVLALNWLLSLHLSAAEASDEMNDCPSIEEVGKSIESRRTTLSMIKVGLDKLLQGDTSTTILPEALFAVDLNDSKAVIRRIQGLKETNQDNDGEKFIQSMRQCSKPGSSVDRNLDELLTLSREVDRLRLVFLTMPLDRRQALITLRKQNLEQQITLKMLEKEKEKAEKTSNESDLSLRIAENKAQTASSPELREAAASRALLEKRRNEVAELTILWTEQLQSLTLRAKTFSDKLSRESAVLTRRERNTSGDLYEGYRSVRDTWRELVDTLIRHLGSPTNSRTLPELPKFQIPLNEPDSESIEAKSFKESQSLLISELKTLSQLKDKVEREEQTLLYGLLLAAGKLRAQYIEELMLRGESQLFALNNDYLSDLFREIRLIPYRPAVLLKSSILETSSLLQSGISGYMILAHQIFALFLFIFTPLASFFLLKRVSQHLDNLRAWLLHSRDRFSQAAYIALWIRRLSAYLPWIIMLVAARLAQEAVTGTELQGAAAIIPYFEYFFFYRIFRLALTETLSSTRAYSKFLSQEEAGIRILKTAKSIGLFFFIAASLLQLTQIVARRGLFYQLILHGLYYLSPILFAMMAYWWKQELAAISIETLHKSIKQRVANLCLGRWAWFFCLPTVVVLVCVLSTKRIVKELSKLDSAKRLSAQIFRRKLETAAKGRESIAKGQALLQDYLSFFELGTPSDNSLLIAPEVTQFQHIVEIIDAWDSGLRSEHTLAIQGEKGIGKSSLLSLVQKHFSNLNVIRLSVPDKITEEGHLFQYLGRSLGFDLTSQSDFLTNIASHGPKTLILIDEGQNLFLARPGGFRAYRAFINLCNISSSRFFWCVTINRYSWAYLNAVTGGSQYFRRVFTIESWSDRDIKALILGRHEKTDYTLQYDPIIFALNSTREVGASRFIEDRYFELLWDQSKGNPRTALSLWLSALQVIGEKQLMVGLPAALPVRPLAGLTDDELFVIAAIIRHENLTAFEAKAVTSLSEGIVLHAVRVGVERGFLECSSAGRFRICPIWQASMTQSLVNKNFVYG